MTLWYSLFWVQSVIQPVESLLHMINVFLSLLPHFLHYMVSFVPFRLFHIINFPFTGQHASLYKNTKHFVTDFTKLMNVHILCDHSRIQILSKSRKPHCVFIKAQAEPEILKTCQTSKYYLQKLARYNFQSVWKLSKLSRKF